MCVTCLVKLLGEEGVGRKKMYAESERKNRATYSDLIIVTLVLHVLIKFFLGVKLNAPHLQFLPNLKHKKICCGILSLIIKLGQFKKEY